MGCRQNGQCESVKADSCPVVESAVGVWVPTATTREPVVVQTSMKVRALPWLQASACDTAGANAANQATHSTSHSDLRRCAKGRGKGCFIADVGAGLPDYL